MSPSGPAAPQGGRHRDEPADEINLGPYIQGLWRRRYFIALLSLATVAVVIARDMRAPKQYTARAAVAITAPKLDLSKLDLRPSTPGNTASYRPILESPNLAARVVQELGLDKQGVSATTFFDSVLRIEEVRNSTVFILRATFVDPELAAKVANRVAALAVEDSRRLNQDEAVRVRNDLKAQVDEAFAGLQEAETKLLDYKKSGPHAPAQQGAEPAQAQPARAYAAEATLKRLEADADVARKVYQDIGIAYQTARLQVAGRSPELQMIESAIPPDRPLSKNLARDAAIAFAVSLVAACALALVYNAFSENSAAA